MKNVIMVITKKCDLSDDNPSKDFFNSKDYIDFDISKWELQEFEIWDDEEE